MTGLAGGAALLLAALLLVAGVLKLGQPRPFAHAVYRLLPKHLGWRGIFARLAPWTVGGVEIVTGAALLVTAAHPSALVAGCAAALYLGFVAAVATAIRKGTSCGCFSSFSDGAAGPAELTRALALATLALVVFAQVLLGAPASWWRLDSLLWLVFLAVDLVVLAAVAGRARPPAWLLLGRVNSRLAAVELPTAVALSSGERARLVADARRSPSVRAFEAWLGERAAQVDWRRCEFRGAAATPPGAPRIPCQLIMPRCRNGLTVTLSVPPDPDHTVVIAVVDGRPVSVIAGRVVTAPPRTPASPSGSPPPAAPRPRPEPPRTTVPATTARP